MISSLVLLILAVICLVTITPLGIFLLIVAAGCLIGGLNKKNSIKGAMEQWQQKYSQLNTDGLKEIDACVAQWNQARSEASRYETGAPSEVA